MSGKSGLWAVRWLCAVTAGTLAGGVLLPEAHGDDIPVVMAVDRQPLEAAVERLTQALVLAGSPLPSEDHSRLEALRGEAEDASVVRGVQEVLDPRCLLLITINPESRVKVSLGGAKTQLDQRGWTNFLVKVVNEAGVTAPLVCSSPQAEPMVRRSSSASKPAIVVTPADAARRWLDIAMVDSQPMTRTLSGLPVEYRILQLYSRDAGQREATLALHVGQGTQDLGFRSEVPILFDCRPAIDIPLVIRDHDGQPTTCSLLIRDQQRRVYPNPSRRLAPDFFFHEQIYRADGESIQLAPGDYHIVAYRGPEYLPTEMRVQVAADRPQPPVTVQLQRWIHMAREGWFSGDHHVHAAGCAHYENPTEGVTPEDMLRHLVGEDLNVGCVLSWGPCWYYQKQFFDGQVSKLSRPGSLMRYDVEVSGFPSAHAGHLCLLNLSEDDYPGTYSIEEWPTWTMPILQWGQQQGGVVGYSHSGWGLALPDYLPDGSRGGLPNQRGTISGQRGRAADRLPDYAMPPFDGIGANEFIVTTAHGVCDFISAVDTPAMWELNIWYHTLNCGFRSRISGETDFPCIYGERVGLGRSYVHLPQISNAADLQYADWVQGLKAGSSYVSDGLSHLLQFSVGDCRLGHSAPDTQPNQLAIPQAGPQTVRCRVAAWLPEIQDQSGRAIAARRLDEKPYWHLERARQRDSRRVPVELVINGQAVAQQLMVADGTPQHLEFQANIQQSSWVAVRILPSMHSNPIFVTVAEQPIRASRRSAAWCREAVEVCWSQKRAKIRPEEMQAAKEAYDTARELYAKIQDEAQAD